MAIPESIASLPMLHLRNTLARSSAFQSFVSAKSNIDALDSIHYISTTDAPPFAVVDVMAGEWQKVAQGAFDQGGELELILRVAISDSSDAAQGTEAVTFLNTAGNIIKELLALAAAPDCFLNISNIRHGMAVRPRREDRATVGDFYELVLNIGYEGGL